MLKRHLSHYIVNSSTIKEVLLKFALLQACASVAQLVTAPNHYLGGLSLKSIRAWNFLGIFTWIAVITAHMQIPFLYTYIVQG